MGEAMISEKEIPSFLTTLRFNPVCHINDWSILAAENSGARVLAGPQWVGKMECHKRLEALVHTWRWLHSGRGRKRHVSRRRMFRKEHYREL